MDLDLRIVAVILALLSLVGGAFLNVLPLLGISATLVVIGACVLIFTPRGAPGTSGYLGLVFLVVGGCAMLILPAWIAYTIKLLVHTH